MSNRATYEPQACITCGGATTETVTYSGIHWHRESIRCNDPECPGTELNQLV